MSDVLGFIRDFVALTLVLMTVFIGVFVVDAVVNPAPEMRGLYHD